MAYVSLNLEANKPGEYDRETTLLTLIHSDHEWLKRASVRFYYSQSLISNSGLDILNSTWQDGTHSLQKISKIRPHDKQQNYKTRPDNLVFNSS